MPSPNTLPVFSGLFTATAPIVNIPVLNPQLADEGNASLAKINQLLVNSAGGGSPNSGNYTAVNPYYATTTGAGTLPASLTSFSFYSAGGGGTASFNGVSVPSGVTLQFDAAPGTKFSQVSYNGNGSSVFIAGSQLI